MGNDAPIPSNPVTDSVKNYGAVGNGIVDDSGAFLAAIARLRPGSVLYVPAGKPKIVTTANKDLCLFFLIYIILAMSRRKW